MQAVIVVPDSQTLELYGGADKALMRKVCGVPMLVRNIQTVICAGINSLAIIWPNDVPLSTWHHCRTMLASEKVHAITIVLPETADPESESFWWGISPILKDTFVWLPWNWITHKRALMELTSTEVMPNDWSLPAKVAKRALDRRTPWTSVNRCPEGVPVVSATTATEAERLVVARSGKPLDGIYSTFNRWLCRPFVRCISHTPITPNAVTLAGLAVAILSAVMFAEGFYAAYVAGALCFFLSGLFDEMDGMLARVKFRESAFGTWFEGFVDNATYLLVFGGMTIGLYHQRGAAELVYGIALIVGCVLSVIVINLQRKRSTDPARPNEYLGKMYGLLDKDSSNVISKAVRHVHVFLKKAVSIHYLLIFTVLGGLPLFLRLAALGSNLTWIVGLYFSHRFFRRAPAQSAAPNIRIAA